MRKEVWLIWKSSKTRRGYKIGVLSYDQRINGVIKSNVKFFALVASLNFESQFNDEYITVTVKLIFDTN